ncbi:hypothetical protein RHGRI_033434 [Rhododendron griersonianum]|uniref:Uncharacterized protein n=1 Tax=Rhododendron griersonianum TaxID=479676 RepID=A0AAV6I102_9ERIC|nr:hypothetical protein RHGRI_033434 [Rhododendron griersonianum]
MDAERSEDEGKSLEQRKKIGKKLAKKKVYNSAAKKVYNKTHRDKLKRTRLLQLETSVATGANSTAGHSSSLRLLETSVATGANLAAGVHLDGIYMTFPYPQQGHLEKQARKIA